jgi:hypothetical protein
MATRKPLKKSTRINPVILRSVRDHNATGKNMVKLIFERESPFLSAFIYRFILAASFITGIFICLRHSTQLGIGFIGAGVVLAFFGRFVEKLKPVAKYGLVILGWILLAEAFSVVPDYGPLLPQGLIFHTQPFTGLLFLVGCVLIFLGYHYFPDNESQAEDFKPATAWLILSCFMIFSAWTTYINLDVPDGYQCDDADAPIEAIMRMKELHQYFFIAPYSLTETGPFFMTAILWKAFPTISSIHIQFLGGEVMALLNLWLLFLLGKEVRNRRTGLLLAAIGTGSKWIPGEVISGYYAVSATLAVTWCLLAFFKLVKNPTWLCFLNWGLAISFGTYMYPAFRLFGIFMIFLTFFWMIFSHREWKWSPWGWWFSFSLTVFWFANFLIKNHFLSNRLILDFYSIPSLLFLLVFFAVFLFKTIESYLKNGRDKMALMWAVALMIVALLIFPMVNDKDYGARFAIVNPLAHGANSLGALFKKIGFTFRAHFMGEGIFGTSAFDFQTAWIVVLGIIAFLAKPRWVTLVLFGAVWVGLANHFIPDYSYNGRAAVCITPIFLLAAISLEHLQLWGGQIWNRKSWNVFSFLLFSIFFVWQCWTSYQTIYRSQIYYQGIDGLVSRQVLKDSPANRTYLCIFPNCASPECQGILDEGHPLYVLDGDNPKRERNAIYLSLGEVPKNVVLIIFAGDLKFKNLIQSQFPKAEWTGINAGTFQYPTATPGDNVPRFYRVFIPADQISSDSRKVLYFVTNEKARWRRDFYWLSYRPGYGSINYEDQTASLWTPYPTNEDLSTASFDRTFKILEDAKYAFYVQDPNFALLQIDGQNVIDNRRDGEGPYSAQKTVYLGKGNHTIHYSVYFRVSQTIPDIKIKQNGSDVVQSLDDFGIQ